jgi:hypothetical protein
VLLRWSRSRGDGWNGGDSGPRKSLGLGTRDWGLGIRPSD